MATWSIHTEPARRGNLTARNALGLIYVAPLAPTWFQLLVQQVLDRYGLDYAARQSTLLDGPLY